MAGLFVAALDRDLPDDEARALAFAALVTTNAGLVLVDRAGRTSLLATFKQPNPALCLVLGITSAILAAIMLIPSARDLFGFGQLHGTRSGCDARRRARRAAAARCSETHDRPGPWKHAVSTAG